MLLSEIRKYKEINAIIIVQNGSEARRNISVKNALVKIRGILPKAAENNIILILTNTPVYPNFDIKSLQVPIKNYFCMDNNAFNSPPNPGFADENFYEELQRYWNISMRKIKEIAEYLRSMVPFDAKCFKEMMEEIDKAKQSFHQTKAKLSNLYNLMDQLENFKMLKESTIFDAKTYENYVETKTIEQIEWVKVDYHSTVCSNDDSLCHENCGLEYCPQQNGEVFAGCACMKKGDHCKKCGCGPESHYHTMKIPRKVQKNVKNVLQDVKDKFDKCNAKAKELEQQEQEAASEMQQVQSEIDSTKLEIRFAVRKLKQVAPNYNLAQEIDCIIQQTKMQLRDETNQNQRVIISKSIKVLEEIYKSLNF